MHICIRFYLLLQSIYFTKISCGCQHAEADSTGTEVTLDTWHFIAVSCLVRQNVSFTNSGKVVISWLVYTYHALFLFAYHLFPSSGMEHGRFCSIVCFQSIKCRCSGEETICDTSRFYVFMVSIKWFLCSNIKCEKQLDGNAAIQTPSSLHFPSAFYQCNYFTA